MLRLTSIGIPARIAIACALPLIAFSAFAGKQIFDKRADLTRAETLAIAADAAPLIAGFVHELQKERGVSGGFINSKGAAMADALRSQRGETDKAAANWPRVIEKAQAVGGSQFAEQIAAITPKIAELRDMRAKIDALSATGEQAAEYFSATISAMIGTVDSFGGISDDPGIVRAAIAVAAHIRRKEFAGQERAYGTMGFSGGEFKADTYRLFLRAQTVQEAQIATFKRNANREQIDAIEAQVKDAAKELSRLHDIGNNAPFAPDAVRAVGAAQWFAAATTFIDALKVAEDKLLADFSARISATVSGARWAFWGLLGAFIGLLGVTGTATVLVALSITRPVARLVETMGELAQQNNDVDVEGTERGDEIGHMARAVLVFRDAAREKLRLEGESERQRCQAEEERQRNAEAQAKAAAEQAKVVRSLGDGLSKLAEGDLSFRLDEADFTDAYRQIKDDFNAAVVRLNETVSALAGATKEVASTAAEIATSTTDLSQRTEEQAASLEQTSASMEQMAATVKRNAENAQHANQFTADTREVADKGGAVVAEAVDAMARIEESSRKISDIISVIDEIARQTNLLALNAAVEAARAGEAGRGFAVVASEVRSLAQRSSQAAKDIKDLITNSTGQVSEGVELVSKAGASLTEIVESIKKVAEIVSEIANASAEQATGIDQVNTALTQMDQVTQQNSALVEENAAAAKALQDQSAGMEDQVGFFTVANTDRCSKAAAQAA
ncbi:MAG TPA: methyl-accepting chemotaxis protein [Pseudolabrys sp.]|nr:methyl-accepting chemotaxis protein [Pseudolabrys sp.]